MWKRENVKASNTNWKSAASVLAAVATLAAFTAAFADGPADTQLTLGEVELPVYMSAYNQAFTQPTVA